MITDDPEEEAWLLLEKRLKAMEEASPAEGAFLQYISQTSYTDRAEAWRHFEAGYKAGRKD